MTAGQLFQAGNLDQAVQALGAELRDNPGDVQRRTFLFELLCFAGAYDRAEKQLDVLAQGGKDAQLGALLYAGALHAERTRTDLFQKKEYYAAGQYMWLPLEHIASIEMEAPKRLRDLLWSPALVRTGPAFKGRELGEVLLPVLTPLAFLSADDAVRLGRLTVWQELEDGGSAPAGQKMFLVDDEEFPLLELRQLEFHARQTDSAQHASTQ